MGGLNESPTDHPLVKMTLDGAKRSLSKLIKPKEPLPFSFIQDIALRFSSDNALSVIRFLFILLVGYAGFLRGDEILKIKVCDVKIHVHHMLVSVPERKNDQLVPTRAHRTSDQINMYHRKDFGAITAITV